MNEKHEFNNLSHEFSFEMTLNESSPFLKLPPELQLQICTFLEPIDLIKLRQTCTTFHRLNETFHETLWRSCLESVCLKDDIYRPTFKSTISSKRLEVAAMTPFLFKSLVKRHQSPGSPLMDYNCHLFGVEALLWNIWVVPGGRFILGFTDHSLLVWDFEFGLPNDNKPPPPPVVVLDLRPLLEIGSVTTSGADETKIRLAAQLVDFPESHSDFDWENQTEVTTFAIYELDLAKDKPTITLLGVLPIFHKGPSRPSMLGFDIHTMSKETFVVFLNGFCLVWNFSENSCVGWPVPQRYCDMFSTSNKVIFLGERGVGCFQLPLHFKPLEKPFVCLSSFANSAAPPFLELRHEHEHIIPDEYDLNGPPFWDGRDGQPLFYNIKETVGKHAVLYRYQLDVDPTAFSAKLQLLQTYETPEPPGLTLTHQPFSLCDGQLATLWSATDNFNIPDSLSVSIMGSAEPAEMIPDVESELDPALKIQTQRLHLVPLLTSMSIASITWDFCPASGLLAVLLHPPESEDHSATSSIQIYDFVGPYLAIRV